jgi:hypothetical protein
MLEKKQQRLSAYNPGMRSGGVLHTFYFILFFEKLFQYSSLILIICS